MPELLWGEVAQEAVVAAGAGVGYSSLGAAGTAGLCPLGALPQGVLPVLQLQAAQQVVLGDYRHREAVGQHQ